jgi:hypothetical protein
MNKDINNEIKMNVMARVRAIHAMRKAGNPVLVKSAAFAALLAVFFSSVSVADVIANMLASMKASGNALYFLTSAFSHSLLTVKLVVVAECLVGLALLKDALARLPLARA